MKKNLVVLHLESLSNCLFDIYRDELISLREIMAKSIRFKNFFSSATSSAMAICDLFHGNSFEMEHFTSFDDLGNKIAGRQKNLFAILHENKYKVRAVGCPIPWRDDFKNFHIWPPVLEPFKWCKNEEDFFENISSHLIKEGDRPFALYIYDIRSHFYHRDPNIKGATDGFEAIRIGYSCIDRTINHLYRMLEKNNLLHDTLIVGFGDHGDELWCHSLNGGFCHAFEPYTNIISTPAFIYKPGENPRDIEDLVSLIDLKKTVLNLLQIEVANDDLTDGGIDVFKKKNEIIYSRNLFINQNPSKMLLKSYSATNKKYHLVVSELGLELFAYRMDPGNHSNLLSFFNIDSKGVITFSNRGASHVHFRRTMSNAQISEIKRSFKLLYMALRRKLEYRNKLISGKDNFPFNMHNLQKVRRRKYYWIYPRCISWRRGKYLMMKDTERWLHQSLPGRVIRKLLHPIKHIIDNRKALHTSEIK